MGQFNAKVRNEVFVRQFSGPGRRTRKHHSIDGSNLNDELSNLYPSPVRQQLLLQPQSTSLQKNLEVPKNFLFLRPNLHEFVVCTGSEAGDQKPRAAEQTGGDTAVNRDESQQLNQSVINPPGHASLSVTVEGGSDEKQASQNQSIDISSQRKFAYNHPVIKIKERRRPIRASTLADNYASFSSLHALPQKKPLQREANQSPDKDQPHDKQMSPQLRSGSSLLSLPTRAGSTQKQTVSSAR